MNDILCLRDGLGKSLSWVAHMHFECSFLDCLSSLHVLHWETGRPFFLISNNGRLVCLQEEDLCPLIQDSLEYLGE